VPSITSGGAREGYYVVHSCGASSSLELSDGAASYGLPPVTSLETNPWLRALLLTSDFLI
jgi:hypothetical protein